MLIDSQETDAQLVDTLDKSGFIVEDAASRFPETNRSLH
jgi:hypothetical protein